MDESPEPGQLRRKEARGREADRGMGNDTMGEGNTPITDGLADLDGDGVHAPAVEVVAQRVQLAQVVVLHTAEHIN